MLSKEKQIEIIMEDGFSRKGAEEMLKIGATVFTDFEENFDLYMEEWKAGFSSENDEDYIAMVEELKNMIETGYPATDWGVVKKDGTTFYIEYVL